MSDDASAIEVEASGDGYRVRTPSHEGITTLTVLLAEASDVSDGALADDTATALATVKFLVGHQDAADLPTPIEIGDVVAAYDDAVVRITALRA